MKLRLVSLAALAIAGQAHALNIAQTNAATQIYVSGASATKNIISALFTQNCTAGTLTTYKSKADSTNTSFTTAGAGDSSDGDSFNTYSCTLPAVNDFGVAAGNYAFHKRDRDGSGHGVFPVAHNTAIEFMKISAASCTGTDVASGTNVCTQIENKQPHGGVSDVEPALFNPGVNRPAAFAAQADVADSDYDSVTKVFEVGHGVAVSQKLYDDLQAEQVALGQIAAGAQPIISLSQVGAIARSGYDASIAWKGLLPLHDGVARAGINGGVAFANTNGSVVNVCRREVGSGSQAVFNRFFYEQPVSSISILPASASDSVAGAYVVTENTSSGKVRTCLATAGSSQYAIGVLSLDSGTAGATGWKFARINASAPGRTAIKSGAYPYVFVSTVQVNKAATVNGASATAQKALLNGFALAARKPSNLAVLSANAQDAVAAVPDADDCAAIDFVYTDGANANEKFCSRLYRENSLDLPILAK